MLVNLATAPARDDRPNEDFAAVSANAAILVDGAGVPAGSPTGCTHGVAWYARTLGTALLSAIDHGGSGSLADGLRATISGMRALHADTCDLDHAGSPSATVIAVRKRAEWVEYLVLADSVLVAEVDGAAPIVITDDRESVVGSELRGPVDALPTGTAEHSAALRAFVEAKQAYRNVEGGFWVASADPVAADHAFTGVLPVKDLNAVALLSDGASRLADRFGQLAWPDLLKLLKTSGPGELIARTRKAEAGDVDGRRWPRGKTYDDATAVYIQF